MRSIAGLISKDHYSPDAVIMHFEKNEWPTNTRISTKTLYRYIAEGLIVDVTEKNLLHHGTRSKIAHGRPRRHKRVASARKSISLRPESVETRKDYGHWEMDCVVSGKDKGTDALFVLTERKTRYEIIRKIPDQTANSVVKELNRLEHQFGSRKFRTMFKTITCDNGSEFMDSVGIERSSITKLKRTTVYYAHPYCASERGSNENANSIIRRFIPKGSAIRNSNKKKIKLMQDWMNNYPRRILNGLSAADLQRLNFT